MNGLNCYDVGMKWFASSLVFHWKGLPKMVRYPVTAPMKIYQGANEKRLRQAREHNEIADDLVRYVNATFEADGADQQEFLYSDIARKTGYTLETVRDILFAVDCGHNGLSVFRA